MSPIPSIRSAIRSGWKTSMASSFSPIPTNLMGFSTTALMVSAAPPRVSPSSLVRTTPSKSSNSLKALAVFTASCPVMASTTNKISCGFSASFKAAISRIISSSMASRPAVSTITTWWPMVRACATAFFAIFTGSRLSSSVKTSTLI